MSECLSPACPSHRTTGSPVLTFHHPPGSSGSQEISVQICKATALHSLPLSLKPWAKFTKLFFPSVQKASSQGFPILFPESITELPRSLGSRGATLILKDYGMLSVGSAEEELIDRRRGLISQSHRLGKTLTWRWGGGERRTYSLLKTAFYQRFFNPTGFH